MFEFMYAKKVKTDTVMEIIEKYKDDYYIHVTHKPNGNIEILIGGKRSEVEER